MTPEEFAEALIWTEKIDGAMFGQWRVCFANLKTSGWEKEETEKAVAEVRQAIVTAIIAAVDAALYTAPFTDPPEKDDWLTHLFEKFDERSCESQSLLRYIIWQKTVIKHMATDNGYNDGVEAGKKLQAEEDQKKIKQLQADLDQLKRELAWRVGNVGRRGIIQE